MPMPPSASDARRARILYLVLAGLVPCLVVAWANGVFTYNHFYATGPFIHDAGWFSHTVFRQGLSPSNPPVAEGAPHYFSLHLSLIVTLGSLLSYVFPGDRVAWYCVFQAMVHAPLGAAVGLLIAPQQRPRRAVTVAAVGAVALAFAFNGDALAAMGFPQFEVLLSAGICVMLAGLATARRGIGWIGLVIAVSTREDGGAHAATFLAAALAGDLLGRPFPVARRRIIAMIVVALLSTLTMMLVQKKLFHAVPLFEKEYLGRPIYAHLTNLVLRARVSGLFDKSLFVILPFALTGVLAGVDRDGRWMLGWLATLPWFALNFLAHQELKAEFGLYTGFAFIAGIFWMGAYARAKYGPSARLRLVYARLVAVSAVSTLARAIAFPEASRLDVGAMLAPADVDGPAIRSYAKWLRASTALRGKLLVDPGMASWLTESLGGDAVNHGYTDRTDYLRYDAMTFFRDSQLGPSVHNILVNGRFTQCGALPRSVIVFCNRPGSPLPPGFLPFAVLKRSLFASEYVRREANGDLVVRATPEQKLGIYGPFARLAAGRYRAVFGIRRGDCPSVTDPRAEVEVFANNHVLGTGTLREPSGRVTIDFDAPAARLDAVELRTFTGACPYTVENVDLSPLSAEVGIPQ
ncbi:hypothetical protein BH11MYX4_BH11MYX4_31800 [soil metagenome]